MIAVIFADFGSPETVLEQRSRSVLPAPFKTALPLMHVLGLFSAAMDGSSSTYQILTRFYEGSYVSIVLDILFGKHLVHRPTSSSKFGLSAR